MSTMTRRQETYLRLLSNAPSVEFHEFEDAPTWIRKISENASLRKIEQIDTVELSDEKKSEWIKKILHENEIKGNMLFAFSGLGFARVTLPTSYEWVKPLWFHEWQPGVATNFTFVSTLYDFWLSIDWTEMCISSNCYKACRAEKLQ